MPTFYLPTPGPLRPKQASATELAGADVDFTGGGMHVVNGDWATIAGKFAAQQSVIRTAVSAPGSLVRRPGWGAGGAASLFKPLTPANVASIVAKQQAALQSNPRVQKVLQVTANPLPSTASSTAGRTIKLVYIPVGSQDPTTNIVQPALNNGGTS
jgi:phage baseplate assembly protein W